MRSTSYIFTFLVCTVLLSACGGRQFSQMPEGPLQQYHYSAFMPNGGGMGIEMTLGRNDSGEGGTLVYRDMMQESFNNMLDSVIVPVGEEVFQHVYDLLSQHRLYELEEEYSSLFPGHHAMPWDLQIRLSQAVIASASKDGTTPDGFEYADYYCVQEYLEKVAYDWAVARQAERPLSLLGFSYDNMGLDVLTETDDEGRTFLALQEWPSGKETMRSLADSVAFNTFVLRTTGDTLRLRWVYDRLMLVATSRTGKPLFTAQEHAMRYRDFDWDRKMELLLCGKYTDDQGREIDLASSSDHVVKGFQGKDELSFHWRYYKDRAACFFELGDYPDEQVYCFCPSVTGINLYKAEIDPEWEEDGRVPDYVRGEPVGHLTRSSRCYEDFLQDYTFDSYDLRYYDARERQLMIALLEKADVLTPEGQWNLWLLRHFDSAVPVVLEADLP